MAILSQSLQSDTFVRCIRVIMSSFHTPPHSGGVGTLTGGLQDEFPVPASYGHGTVCFSPWRHQTVCFNRHSLLSLSLIFSIVRPLDK